VFKGNVEPSRLQFVFIGTTDDSALVSSTIFKPKFQSISQSSFKNVIHVITYTNGYRKIKLRSRQSLGKDAK